MAFVYFDLDGVLRNLAKDILGHAPKTWDDKTSNGIGVLDYIEANLNCLEEAPPTKLLPIARKTRKIVICSHQPEHWRPYTDRWCKEHIGRSGMYGVMYFDSSKAKMDFIMSQKPKCWIVEDHPCLCDYSRVALVDWPYNRDAQAPVRIKHPRELYLFLHRNGMIDEEIS